MSSKQISLRVSMPLAMPRFASSPAALPCYSPSCPTTTSLIVAPLPFALPHCPSLWLAAPPFVPLHLSLPRILSPHPTLPRFPSPCPALPRLPRLAPLPPNHPLLLTPHRRLCPTTPITVTSLCHPCPAPSFVIPSSPPTADIPRVKGMTVMIMFDEV